MAKNDIIVIELDKIRELRLTNKTAKKLEKVGKKPIMQILGGVNDMLTEELEKIIHALLQDEDPSLTLDRVIDLLDEKGLIAVDMQFKIMEVITAKMGNEDEIKNRVENITGKKMDPNALGIVGK